MANAAHRLAEILGQQIADGVLAECARLPSIDEIAVIHGCSRGIAERALVHLRRQGLVTARHGAGYFVTPERSRIQRHVTKRRTLADGVMRIQGVRISEELADDFIADCLGLTVGDPVIRISRSYSLEGRRVQAQDSYIPAHIAQGTLIATTDPGPGGVYARLGEMGLAPTRFAELSCVQGACPEEAARLDLRKTDPLIWSIVRVALAGDRPVEVCHFLLDVESYALTSDSISELILG